MSREDLIRKEILLQVYAARPLALTPERIARDAKKNDYDYSASEIERELFFLNDENLIKRVEIPGVTALGYRISSIGIRQYEQKYAA